MPAREKTTPQVLASTGFDGVLTKAQPWDWPQKVRGMRHDPTISFLRRLLLAPLLTSPWSVTSDDNEFKSAESDVEDNFLPFRRVILSNVVRGYLDFGWQSFENVWWYNEESGRVYLKKAKPLLQEITHILVTPHGELRGVRNQPTYLAFLPQAEQAIIGPWVDLNTVESMIFSHDVEGTNWYGSPIMRSVEEAYDSWRECEKAARRFDTKIAGANWVVHYPMGHSTYDNRTEVDNFEIANIILKKLQSSGTIAVPHNVSREVEDLNAGVGDEQMAWKIELITATSTSESQFVGRQRYIDSLKCRGLGFPERAVTEGQYGTKAEAEAHADFAIDIIQEMLFDTVDQLNAQAVNHLLTVNHGPEFIGHVRLIAAPLSDEKKAQLRSLYLQYLNTQQGQAEEADRIDWAAITDELGFPVKDDGSAGTPGGETNGPAMPGQAPENTSGSPDDPNAAPEPSQPAEASLGEYTELGQRAWTNNLKRIQSILTQYGEGAMKRGFASQSLYSIGLPPVRVDALLDEIDQDQLEPETMEADDLTAPIVMGLSLNASQREVLDYLVKNFSRIPTSSADKANEVRALQEQPPLKLLYRTGKNTAILKSLIRSGDISGELYAGGVVGDLKVHPVR